MNTRKLTPLENAGIVATVPIAELDRLRMDAELLQELLHDPKKFVLVTEQRSDTYRKIYVPLEYKDVFEPMTKAMYELACSHRTNFENEQRYFLTRKATIETLVERVDMIFDKLYPKK